ncbi:MAG: hypothetical protein ACRD03_01565 [Acidimicrobiales bacterium]
MSVRYAVASSGDFRFDTEALISAMQVAFPGSEVRRPTGDLAAELAASVSLPTPPGRVRNMEVDILRGSGAIGIEGARTPEEVAEFVTWLARTAPVPDDGSVVLIEWADDLVPLTPDVTAEHLLALRS